MRLVTPHVVKKEAVKVKATAPATVSVTTNVGSLATAVMISKTLVLQVNLFFYETSAM